MNIDPVILKKRQHFYWLGRGYEEKNDLLNAIEAYNEYSTHLAEKDRHMPHQWISKIYEKLDDEKKSLYHLEKFAIGCSSAKSSEIFKEIGDRYLALNSINRALLNYEEAVKQNPNIGLKKKIETLKKQ